MKILNGNELAGFIKQRQLHQVRSLQQSQGVHPKLAIIQTKDTPVINTYVKLKKAYGSDIGALVDIHFLKMEDLRPKIKELNNNSDIHGIIIQLPLIDIGQTDEITNMVDPSKDVDALGKSSLFDPATPMAIMWLLAGYNIDLVGKKVLLIGRGKLVGAPLEKMLVGLGIDVTVGTEETAKLNELSMQADVIITATGSPGSLTSDMISPDTVVIDAGVASENGKTLGDVAPDVYLRDDLKITPQKGGVGPLTVCVLFENVIKAAQTQVDSKTESK
jgi:methylenetetrahydrofolate dehydrogenase (NADP+) / methenyltetrahydrofolate cyclohydrolase